MIPDRFTYPFRYTPCEEVVEASRALAASIREDSVLESLFGGGKMMGVLLCRVPLTGQIKVLNAFSGLAGGRGVIPGTDLFVPPIFDYAAPDGYFRTREAEISSMVREGEGDPSGASAELQDWLFSNYIVSNALGERLSIKDVFALRGLVPPGGTGECAAPKLLQHSYDLGLQPLAMGEFWYGKSPLKEVREHGRFYPSCTGKCGPLLSWMMKGLDVMPNPLDEKYCGRSPSVIYEDAHIIVVSKPSGMLSVPGRVHAESLLEWLGSRFGEVHSVHRLDRDTSGVMLFARNPAAKVNLEAQFAQRTVEKIYRARLVASPTPFRHRMKGTVAIPLSLDYYDRPRQMADPEQGKKAITQYEVVQELPNGELEVLFRPLTGRSHQIRVHAASAAGLGRPIKGDCLYGAASEDRLYLHAESISFRHPSSGKVITFSDKEAYSAVNDCE